MNYRNLPLVLRWPNNRHHSYVPWWVVIWRLIFAPIMFLGMGLAFVAIIPMYGWRRAVEFLHT